MLYEPDPDRVCGSEGGHVVTILVTLIVIIYIYSFLIFFIYINVYTQQYYGVPRSTFRVPTKRPKGNYYFNNNYVITI